MHSARAAVDPALFHVACPFTGRDDQQEPGGGQAVKALAEAKAAELEVDMSRLQPPKDLAILRRIAAGAVVERAKRGELSDAEERQLLGLSEEEYRALRTAPAPSMAGQPPQHGMPQPGTWQRAMVHAAKLGLTNASGLMDVDLSQAIRERLLAWDGERPPQPQPQQQVNPQQQQMMAMMHGKPAQAQHGGEQYQQRAQRSMMEALLSMGQQAVGYTVEFGPTSVALKASDEFRTFTIRVVQDPSGMSAPWGLYREELGRARCRQQRRTAAEAIGPPQPARRCDQRRDLQDIVCDGGGWSQDAAVAGWVQPTAPQRRRTIFILGSSSHSPEAVWYTCIAPVQAPSLEPPTT
eukprot:jgi/Tetstr1/456271/TSEL_043031.t2